ncbi:molybdopterin molybdotransferase MoeA [Acidithiobacillus thiooxidans]|uniref:Molybdopterin molybdenumtransferase n=1 Tax=Acidithiobacillus thiooxidans ATCC 19377 TaxID=637390 RepID=A0A543Q417_ACITH|nr:gephyrin-like molybdotransferase Glp [Acidithiobacillus thiooxidans]MDR7925425.1 molybdopterin molybdotransferase MoeA [Acidithiobacillus thiooxidans]MDX5934802.1 molybdopterin molybdotransferase MoeA [Acidithiobacillus thiooxidans]TQN51073.1 Molybdopterin molybdenumtransferase [Acidithiobacillus thiooxidans ATCC 19377]
MAHCCSDNEHDPMAKSVEEARAAILASSPALTDTEVLHLSAALGRVLAEDIRAPQAVPAWPNSAMDGYALRSSDGEKPRQLIGHCFAGHPFTGVVGPGECVRIMTGAVMPEGADSVLIQERAEIQDKTILPRQHPAPGANIRQAGEDLQPGVEALPAGTLLRPAQLALLASLGIAEVKVFRRLRVAFFSTGDELRPLGSTLEAGQIYDSNRYALQGMLQRLGCETLDLGRILDNPEHLEKTLQQAAGMADLVISTGGVSVGDADYIAELLRRIGSINFWKMNMKPGRPLAFGQLGEATFFGLPGNPVSTMVTFYQFVQPCILKRMGKSAPWTPTVLKIPLAHSLKKKPGRTDFQRGVLISGENGLQVAGVGQQASHIMSGLAHADCLIILAAEAEGAPAGSMVDVQLLEGLV